MEQSHFLRYKDRCVIFDGFGVAVQLALGTICILALILKRYLDPFRRPWSVWLMVTRLRGEET